MSYEEARRVCAAAFEAAKAHALTREAQHQHVALMAGKDHRLMDALVTVATHDKR
jgi:hypothetical protein